MIQLNTDCIYLHTAGGEPQPLSSPVIVEAFTKSGLVQAHIETWQLEEMAQALIHYFRHDLQIETVEAEDFARALAALSVIMACKPTEEKAAYVHSTNLYHLAQQSGCAFELGFFGAIERSIAELKRTRARLIRFESLRPCVKLLTGAHHWGKSCQRLSDDIVVFIRKHMLQQAAGDPIAFAVSP